MGSLAVRLPQQLVEEWDELGIVPPDDDACPGPLSRAQRQQRRPIAAVLDVIDQDEGLVYDLQGPGRMWQN